MRVWHLCEKTDLECALEGTKSEKSGGRWNHPGVPLVYAAGTLSLCALETLVHLPPDWPRTGYAALPLEVPDDVSIEEVDPERIHRGWRKTPSPREVLDYGTDWARSKRTAILRVPSAVIPLECNYVLNPLHPEYQRFERLDPVPFSFDPRLLE